MGDGRTESREIWCQFIILARKDEPIPDYASSLIGFGLQWAWRRFYQIALSSGPLQAAASRVPAWSQLARKKAGCPVSARAVLPNHLMNTPRKTFPDLSPRSPSEAGGKDVHLLGRGFHAWSTPAHRGNRLSRPVIPTRQSRNQKGCVLMQHLTAG